jgi:hypothetical protein
VSPGEILRTVVVQVSNCQRCNLHRQKRLEPNRLYHPPHRPRSFGNRFPSFDVVVEPGKKEDTPPDDSDPTQLPLP